MESSKGNDALLTATKVTEFNINHGGYIPVTFGILLLAGCAAAYAIAVTRGNVEAILPLISDAAGSPPQNGIFGTLICIGGMFGVLFMIQRYMIVSEKNRDMSKLVGAVNKLCLCAGIVSMLGITLVTGYPLNFYRNRDIWLRDVGIPHMIGGVILFSLGLVYLGLQCAITLLLKTKNECTLTIRVLLFLACAVAFVYHMMTVPDNFSGISHMYYMNSTDVDTNTTNLLPYPSTLGVDLKLPIDMDGSYFTSAVAEWAFVICFCFFFFTFYSETQEYSLQIIIETHTTHGTEVSDEPKIDFRKASVHQQMDVKPPPPPEVRKFLRRDSTCQTTDDVTKELKSTYCSRPNATSKSNQRNGVKKTLIESELDAKLHKLLNEVDKKNAKVETNGTTQHSISTSTEDGAVVKTGKKDMSEAERSVIEKIEIVVKNAEDDDKKSSETAKKEGGEDEEKPSTCPLAVQ